MKKPNTLFFVILFVNYFSFGQNIIYTEDAKIQKEKTPETEIKNYSSFGIGTGILSFYGDIEKTDELLDVNNFRTGFHLFYEERINNFLGAAAHCVYGKIAQSERSLTRNLNFQSDIIHGNIDAVFHFDNDLLVNRTSSFTPYLTAGFGYLSFNPMGDLKDKNGYTYYYWTDGTIRNKSETTEDTDAEIIVRDYNYETKLTDTLVKYSRTTITFPVSVGIRMKLSNLFDIDFSARYFFTNSDWLENVNTSTNDGFIYYNVSFNYKIGGKPIATDKSTYKKSDFKNLEKLDLDRDGITDDDDLCPSTPRGVFVDSRGCPKDDDLDGIPDYRDKEPNTPKGALVDEDGIAYTDEKVQKHYADSLASLRKDVVEQAEFVTLPDFTPLLKQEGKASAIPAKFRAADENADGYISPQEITKIIDDFFEGQTFLNVAKINELIDYFFEQ